MSKSQILAVERIDIIKKTKRKNGIQYSSGWCVLFFCCFASNCNGGTICWSPHTKLHYLYSNVWYKSSLMIHFHYDILCVRRFSPRLQVARPVDRFKLGPVDLSVSLLQYFDRFNTNNRHTSNIAFLYYINYNLCLRSALLLIT